MSVSPEDLRALIADFDAARLPRERWTHDAHVTVAAWHLMHHPFDEALDRVREGIQRLNAANGVAQTPAGGYHETLTWFYMWFVEATLRSLGPTLAVEARIAAVIAACADRTLPFRYYSNERLMSWEARTSRVPSDVSPMAELI